MARRENRAMRDVEAAKAYDASAATYDREVQGDADMRAILWRHFARAFRDGDHVLDVGCGTGIDALFLAQRGIHVTAIDASSAMIAKTLTRTSQVTFTGRIEASVLDLRDLSSMPPGGFDGIFSSFAALNTLPTLDTFAEDAHRLLRPNGRLIIHLLNRFSLWEWLGLLWRHEWAESRRLGKNRERTFVIGGFPVEHYMTSVDEARAALSCHFHLVDAYGQGIFRPPHTLRRLPPRLVTALGALDQQVGTYRPWINCGRFIVLDMVNRA